MGGQVAWMVETRSTNRVFGGKYLKEEPHL